MPCLLDPFTAQETSLPVDDVQAVTRLVLFTDAKFIVICPGKQSDLVQIVCDAGPQWKDVPFVRDDYELTISRSLSTSENMQLCPGQAVPAIIEYDGTNHIVQFGRR